MDLNELDALLEAAHLPETTVPLCLRGDLQAEWEELNRQREDVRADSARTIAGSSGEGELSRRIEELEQQMAAATLTVRLRALHRKEFQKLVSGHAPRKDNQSDRLLGVNQETFFEALICSCIAAPELDEERAKKLLDGITDAQFSKLADAAWSLNRRDVEVPFSSSASRTTTNSAGT